MKSQIKDNQNQKIYTVDNIQINKDTIGSALKATDSKMKSYEVLRNSFHMMNLFEQQEKYGKSNQQQIKYIVSQDFIINTQPQTKIYIDPTQTIASTKPGTFSKLQRTCKIVDKGVIQYEGDKKQGKLKEIKDFLNKIEHFSGGTKNEKLEWHSTGNALPYRLVLIDNNKNQKALYFKTKVQADRMRIYYINKFKYNGNVSELMMKAYNSYLKREMIQTFKDRLITMRRLMMKRSIKEPPKQAERKTQIRESKLDKTSFNMMSIFNSNANKGINKSRIEQTSNRQKYEQSQSEIINNEKSLYNKPNHNNSHNTSVQYKNSELVQPIDRVLIKSQYRQSQYKPQTNRMQQEEEHDSTYLNQLLSKQENQEKSRISKSRISTNVSVSLFARLQQQYKNELFNTWKQSAYLQQLIKSRRSKVHNILKSNRNLDDDSMDKYEVRVKKPQEDNDNSYNEVSQKGKSSNIGNNIGISQLSSKSRQMNKNVSNSSVSSKRKIRFRGIQFLRLTDIFMKPIVTIIVLQRGVNKYESVFNTILKRKQPHLHYELLVNNGEEQYIIGENQIDDCELQVQCVDYLSNAQLCSDKIQLREKLINKHTLLLNKQKSVRMQLQYSGGSEKNEEQSIQGKVLQLQPLSQKTIHTIHNYWEEQISKKGYYNISKNAKIIQILEESEDVPPSWALSLNQSQYNTIIMIDKASKILGFRITQAIIHILQPLQKIYKQKEQLVYAVMSIFINYARPYYFPSEFNKLHHFHTLLGLQGEIEFSSKVQLQMELMKKIIEIECPTLYDKFKRRNIQYVHLLYSYIYELYSKNMSVSTLIQVWNFCFKTPKLLQMYFILIAVYLCKHYMHELLKCRRHKQIVGIMESQQVGSPQILIRELIIMREKYFTHNNTILQQIKNIFIANKPLEPVLVDFYKKQSYKMDRRRQSKQIEKETLLNKIKKQIPLQIPKYKSKTYSLHIYFYRLPQMRGNLFLKTGGVEYECLKNDHKSYYIIGQVNQEIMLLFVDSKSKQYKCNLKCIQGINRYQSDMLSANNDVIKVQYMCGLLQENSIQVLKRNKSLNMILGSCISRNQFYDSMARNNSESLFLSKNSYRDSENKVKSLFSSAKNRKFNEIQFYMRWIACSSLTLNQKLQYVKVVSENISHEHYLCVNRNIEKLLIRYFIQLSQFPLSNLQFQSYYSDSLQSEFDAPKILKCRLYLPSGKQVKLQGQVVTYYCKKSSQYLYPDIIIQQLIQYLKPYMQTQWSRDKDNEAVLSLLYSSNGVVNSKQIPLIKKNKEILYNKEKDPQALEEQQIGEAQPQVLMTQILPTFSKISTILDYINTGKSTVQNVNKYKNIPQSVNLLKICQRKMNRFLLLRYRQYPDCSKVQIPFLKYFHQLLEHVDVPHMPENIFINSTITDIKNICTFKRLLNFTDNKILPQNTFFRNQLGLYGNLRKLHMNADTVQFFSTNQENSSDPNGLVFINYGYGIYRWEPCIIKSYRYWLKEKKSNLKAQSKPKKQYLVLYKGNEHYVRNHELKMGVQVEQSIVEQERMGKTKIKKQQVNKVSMYRN